MRIYGEVSTDFQYGFGGMGIKFNENKDPVDISEYSGIVFRVKGKGKKYRVEVMTKMLPIIVFPDSPFRQLKNGNR